MKPFLSAVVVALLMGIGASMILEQSQMSTSAKYSSSAVRN